MHHRWPSEDETLTRLRQLRCEVGVPVWDPSHVTYRYPITREGHLQVTNLRVTPEGVPTIPLRVALQGLGIPYVTFWEGLEDNGIEDGRLVLEKREQILARLQETFTRASQGVSLVDELLAERREEARREAEQ